MSEGIDKLDNVTQWFEGEGADVDSPDSVAANPVEATSPGVGNAPAEQNISNPYIASVIANSEAFGAVPDSETSQLTSATDFLFLTARTVKLKVNLPSAIGTEASLSLCTDYEAIDSGYRVNYDSCPIRGVVIDGQFDADLSLVNQVESAIAVIWYPYQESVPVYREFLMADIPDGAGTKLWLWD